jgi:YHS domain-containing protein
VRLLLYFVELLFVALVWRTLGRVIRSFFGATGTGANPSSTGARNSARNANSSPAVHGETARDPVCGMFVSTELSLRLKRDGKTLHFCSQDCLERYERQRAAVSG